MMKRCSRDRERARGAGLLALVLAVAWAWTAGPAYGSGEPVPLNAFNIPPGATVTITFDVDVDNPLGVCANSVSNQGTVTGNNFANVPSDDPDAVGGTNPTITGLDAVALAITKTDGAASEVPGTGVIYTITVTNAGPSSAVAATVADTFPGILTGVTWTCAASAGSSCTAAGSGNINDLVTILSGGTLTYTVNATVSANASGNLVNTATVTKPPSTIECDLANNSATDTDTLTPQVDLAITKSNGVTSVDAGSPTTYTITVTNPGPSDAVGATVADTFPATLTGVTWTCTASAGSSCTAGGSGNISDVVTVRAGGTLTYLATGTVSGTATGTLVNTATVTAPGGTTDTNGGNNSATDTDTINPLADLAITKTDGVTTAVPGMSVTYTIVASNAGPATATGASVTDTFPATLTCSWTCVGAGGGTCTAGPVAGNIADSVTLPAGASATYTAVCDISDTATGSLSNTATIGGGGVTDNTPGNNSATDVDTLLTLDFGDAPDSALGPPWDYPTLLADNGARHGVVVSFRLGAQIDSEADGQPTADADGDDQVSGPNVDDEDGVTLPGFLVTCETASVTVNASAAGKLDAWVDFDRDGSFELGEKAIDNLALVAGNNPVNLAVPCSATATAQTFARFRFSSAGGLAADDVAADGEVEDYPVAIRGLDFGDAADPTYPTLVASNGARHVVGGGGPILGAQVDAEANGQPSAGADGDDLAGVDDEDGVTFTSPLIPGQSANVTVTASAPGVLNAWIDFNADGSFAQAGDQIFTNQAVVAGPNLLTFAVPATASSNTATVSRFRVATAGGLSFTGIADDGEVEDHAVSTAPVADLAITKTDGAATEVPGTTVTYTITVSNAGPDPITGATVTDTFPGVLSGVSWTCVGAGGGTCTAGGSGNISDLVNLPVGGTATYMATGTISAAATGTLVNTASVAVPATSFDPNLANNSATDTDTLTPEADLAITKTDGAATEVPGTSVTYTITATNAAGPSNVTATVADTFPASISGVTWTCVGAGGGTCTAAGSGNINDAVNLPVGGSVTYTATGTIAAAATGTLANTATVTATGGATDPTPGNNSATDTDTLTPQVDLAITKTDGSASEVPGTPVTYTITVINSGPSDAVGATVADTFPASISGVTWTCVGAGGGTCTAAGSGNINDTVNVPVGGSVTYTATGNIASSATGTLVNTATVAAAAGTTDTNPGNNSATDTDTLAAEADLEITKEDSADPPPAGEDLIYTITVENHGPSDALSVVVTDPLPAEVTYVSDDCGGTNTPPWTWNIGTLADGATVTCNITVSINPPPPASISNTATVTSGTTDPGPEPNADTEETQLDATSPEVDNLDSVAGTGDGELTECETARTAVAELRLTFSEDVAHTNDTDPESVLNPANYRLVTQAAGLDFDTVDCATGPGTDGDVEISPVGYDVPSRTVTLEVNGDSVLTDGIHRLVVCGTIEDLAGNPLDGGGGPGEDFVRTFRVDRYNLLADGHFDRYSPACTLAGWSSTNPSDVEIDTPDADGSPLSGSAHNTGALVGFDLVQCVPVAGGANLDLRVAMRVDAGPTVVASLGSTCTFFNAPACGGGTVGSQQFFEALSDTAGGFASFEYNVSTPAAAVSASCRFEVESPFGDPFEAYLDHAFLGGSEIFSDGFETGDTSRWSVTVP
jgi:uncharacterized repeat protein (TIGR01451 family)